MVSCPLACGILVPQPGIQPMYPALECKFLTYGPPGSSEHFFCFLMALIERVRSCQFLCQSSNSLEILLIDKVQSWIFIGGLILKLQYVGHLMPRADSWRRLMLGKIEGKRWSSLYLLILIKLSEIQGCCAQLGMIWDLTVGKRQMCFVSKTALMGYK